jgi:hypothetical protein
LVAWVAASGLIWAQYMQQWRHAAATEPLAGGCGQGAGILGAGRHGSSYPHATVLARRRHTVAGRCISCSSWLTAAGPSPHCSLLSAAGRPHGSSHSHRCGSTGQLPKQPAARIRCSRSCEAAARTCVSPARVARRSSTSASAVLSGCWCCCWWTAGGWLVPVRVAAAAPPGAGPDGCEVASSRSSRACCVAGPTDRTS